MEELRTYFYKLTSDRGGAPCTPPPRVGSNPLLSLAICKPAVRRTAQPGDRIVGLTSRALELGDGYPALSVIYAATVSEVVDAAVYYGPLSPYLKRPDCIYRYDPETGTLRHFGETELHADPRHRRRDLGREGIFENGRILLSRDFTYLGAAALILAAKWNRLRELASSLGQGHRVVTAGKDSSMDREIAELFRAMRKQPSRHTAQKVHADAYDHPRPSPAEVRRTQQSAQVCKL